MSRFKPKVEQFEGRTVPALWAIGMESQWVGTPGDTAAIVEAASAVEAVSLARANIKFS